MPRIAVDAMGGDLAPEEPVRSVARLSLESDIEMVLVGQADRIQALLDAGSYNPAQISVRNCGSVIEMSDDPKSAVRSKRDATIVVAAMMVAAGEADAMVSAGNTGACVLAAARHFSVLPGVRKAALASVFPRQVHRAGQDPLGLLLDVGATVRCDARELVQFAVMGSAYAGVISKVQEPAVGLLNIGTEQNKGGSVLVDAYETLGTVSGLRFVGNVEGNEIAGGHADVIVCEGLLGNVVLKLLEGIGEVATDIASHAARESWRWRLGMAILAPGIRRMQNLTDFRSYGGAPILGFQHLCIKAHGRSTAPAIANAIKVAAKAVRDDITGEIAGAIARLR